MAEIAVPIGAAPGPAPWLQPAPTPAPASYTWPTWPGTGGGPRTSNTPAPAQLAPWAGAIPGGPWYGMAGALPWGDWGEAAWAQVPEGRGQEAMAWLNVMLPWYQQQQAWQQFGQQLGWNQQQFQQELGWAQQQQAQNEALQRELANVQAFGRRQAPHVRWM
jgi:hypothetical protein